MRARIVLAAADGHQDLEIGDRLRVGRLTAARWRRRFLANRLQGIERSLARAPRTGGIPESRVREILRASTAISVMGAPRTSSRSLGRRFGLSHTTVRRLWSESGVRPRWIESAPYRPDPIRPLVPGDVVGVYLRPPEHALAFTLEPAVRPRVREEGSERGTFLPPGTVPHPVPIASADLLNRPPPPPSEGPRNREFLRFLAELERAIGRNRMARIVATVSGGGPAPELRSWLLRRPNLRLDWMHAVDAWTRRVGADLERVGRRSPSKGHSQGRGETARAIGLFLTSYVGSDDPFQWVASPTEIAADGAGARLRYDLSVTGHPGFKKPPAIRASMRSPPVPDPRAREMARVVLRKSLRVRRGEHVAIESWSETLDYANAFVLETLQLGARPIVLYQDEPTYWAAVAGSRPSDLARVGDHLRAAIAKSDALVTFFGPSDRERFHALPAATRFRLGEYEDKLYGAAAKAGTRAVQLALGRASPGSARMYGVDLGAWRNELVDGTTVDPDVLHRRARRSARLLGKGRSLEVSHPNGTRLRLGLRHRPAQVSDGLVPPARPKGDWSLVQLPAGVVSVALDERIADGVFVSNVSNTVGVCDTVGEVDGGRWTFSDGRLRRFAYDRGQDLFTESYTRGGPGKERVGVLSVGLNDRISMAPLLRDQEAGVLTLQVGRNDTAGGTNHAGWWAWLLLRGADLNVDGSAIVKGGKLVE